MARAVNVNPDPDFVEHHPAGYAWTERMVEIEIIDRFEGGAVYGARSADAMWIVIDEGTLADFLPDDDPTSEQLIQLQRYDDAGRWEAAVRARRQQAQERFASSGPSPFWRSYGAARSEWQEGFLERWKRQ